MHEVYVAGLSHVLDALPNSTGRVIYISSTGVYGDSAGEWVDEDSPCWPRRERGLRLPGRGASPRDACFGAVGVVLRLAGIYGPGRILRKEPLLAGAIPARPRGT